MSTKCNVGANRNQAFVEFVFSAFGFVHKIATYEKLAGFQVLIQFTDAETASSARNALDGRSIPRYLFVEYLGSCYLRIMYSAHTELNIKFQSHRSRDYANPYLPVNPTAIEGSVQTVVGPDGKKKEPESNMLLASIENMQMRLPNPWLQKAHSYLFLSMQYCVKIKSQAAQAYEELSDTMNLLPKKIKRCDAVRTEPLHLVVDCRIFWRLKGNNEKPDILLQDIGTWSTIPTNKRLDCLQCQTEKEH